MDGISNFTVQVGGAANLTIFGFSFQFFFRDQSTTVVPAGGGSCVGGALDQ
jgi:hypothetical protein